MRKKFYIFIILSILSCSGDNTVEGSVSNKFVINFIKKNILKNNNTIKQKQVYIIPGAGCAGCTSNIENNLVEYNLTDDKDVIIIYTDLKDYKFFKMKYAHNNIINKHNVYVDKQNILGANGFISFYPEVVIIENDKVIERFFINKENEIKLFNLLEKNSFKE